MSHRIAGAPRIGGFPGLWAKETLRKDAFLTRTGAAG
jgi:hypothetical protein